MPGQIFLKNDSKEHSTQQQFILHSVQVGLGPPNDDDDEESSTTNTPH